MIVLLRVTSFCIHRTLRKTDDDVLSGLVRSTFAFGVTGSEKKEMNDGARRHKAAAEPLRVFDKGRGYD